MCWKHEQFGKKDSLLGKHSEILGIPAIWRAGGNTRKIFRQVSNCGHQKRPNCRRREKWQVLYRGGENVVSNFELPSRGAYNSGTLDNKLRVRKFIRVILPGRF